MSDKDIWHKEWGAVVLEKDKHGVDGFAILSEDNEIICTLAGKGEKYQVLADLIALVPLFLEEIDPDGTILEDAIQEARKNQVKLN